MDIENRENFEKMSETINKSSQIDKEIKKRKLEHEKYME
jgi:hypothetical protein